jgi:hypothetical protein
LLSIPLLNQDVRRFPEPGRDGRGQNQIVVVALSPVGVGIVGRARIDLHAEVEEFLAQYIGQRQPRRYPQTPTLKRGLHGSNEIPLGNAKGDVSHPCYLLRYLIAAVYQDGDRVHALRPEGIHHGAADTRSVDDKSGAIQVMTDGGTSQQADDTLDNFGIRRPQLVSLQVP